MRIKWLTLPCRLIRHINQDSARKASKNGFVKIKRLGKISSIRSECHVFRQPTRFVAPMTMIPLSFLVAADVSPSMA
jgi:hypothetical protein